MILIIIVQDFFTNLNTVRLLVLESQYTGFFLKMSINPLFLGGDIIDLECVEQNTGKENLDRVIEQYIIDDDECENESVKEYTVEKVLEHRFKKVIHSFIYLFVVYYLFQNDLIVITFFRESYNIY